MRVIAFALVILAATAIAAGVEPTGRYCTLFESKAVSLMFTGDKVSVALAAADDWSTYVYTYTTIDSLATFASASTSGEYFRNSYRATAAYALDNNTVMLFGSNKALRLTRGECNMTTAYDGQYCGFRNGSPYELTISANTYQMVFSGQFSCTATGMIYNGMMTEETLSCSSFYTHKFTMADGNIKLTASDTTSYNYPGYYELVANKSECPKFDSFAQGEYCGKVEETGKAMSLIVSGNTFVLKGDGCTTRYGGFSLTAGVAKIMFVPLSSSYSCLPSDATATYTAADGFAFTSATKKMNMKIGNCNTTAIPNGVYCYIRDSSSTTAFGKLEVSGSQYTKTVVTPGKAAGFNGFTTTEATTTGTFVVDADKKISSTDRDMTKWDPTKKIITVDTEDATMANCGGSIADATYCGIDKDNEPMILWTIGSNSMGLATNHHTYTGVYTNNFTEVETTWPNPTIDYDAGNDVFVWNEKTNLTVASCSNMFTVPAGSYCGVHKGVFYNATVSGLLITEPTLKINGSAMGASDFTETSLGANFDYAFDNTSNALNITRSSTTYELTAKYCKDDKVIPDGVYSGLAGDGKTPVAAVVTGRAISFAYGSDDSSDVCLVYGSYTRGAGTAVWLSLVPSSLTYNGCNITYASGMTFSGSSISMTAVNNVTNVSAVLSMPNTMPGETIPDGMYCNYAGKAITVSGSKMSQTHMYGSCTDESFYYMAAAPSATNVKSTIRVATYKTSCGFSLDSATYSYYGGISIGSGDTFTTYKCGGGASLQQFELNMKYSTNCNTSTGIYPSTPGSADGERYKVQNGSYCDTNDMNTAIVINGDNVTVPTFGYADCGFSAAGYTYVYRTDYFTLSGDHSTPDSCPITLGRGSYSKEYSSYYARLTVSGVYGSSYNATQVGFAVNTSIIVNKDDLFSQLETSLSLQSSAAFLLVNVSKQVIDSKNATVYLVQFNTPTQASASVALATDQKMGGVTGASAIGGSSAPSSFPTDEKKDDKKKPLGLYVGAAVGAIAFLAIVIVAIKFATAPKAAPAGGDDYRPMNAVTNV